MTRPRLIEVMEERWGDAVVDFLDVWAERDLVTLPGEWKETAPLRFLDACIEDLEQPDAVLAAVAEWLLIDDLRPDLLILGPVGTGKTYLAMALADAWLVMAHHCQGCLQKATRTPRQVRCAEYECYTAFFVQPGDPHAVCPSCGHTRDLTCRGRRHHEPWSQAVFVAVGDLFDDLRPGGDGKLSRYTGCGLLVLDDLGSTRRTDWSDETLFKLINARWVDTLPTIVTSNLSPAGLRRAVGERVYDRLRDGAIAVQLAGPSRRSDVLLG